ncbi:MAG: AAA family ATPase [Ruminococcaceae bacterium]|nr:AAA family ATPase [Oscillospiraceae bacterium]
MIYLKKFRLPTLAEEEDHAEKFWPVTRNTHCHEYPYGIFPFKKFQTVEFSEITIFCGGNGSGKTTLLNLIAEALELPRITPYNRSTYFSEYVKLMCSFEVSGGEHRDIAPYGSSIYTSDDVFYKIIDRRVENEETRRRRHDIAEEYREKKRHDVEPMRFRSMDDYDELEKRLEVRRRTMTQYVNHHAGVPQTPDSNGEYALNFFRDHFNDNCLYLLDEPENSLSPKYQLKLIKLVEDYSRFFGCQFVISTHSPFLMSLKGALIYDLDSIPVTTKRWWDIENMKLYYQLFSEYKDKFEK